LAYAAYRGGLESRLFALFSALLFIASLATPNTGSQGHTTQWEFLAGIPATHYWFFPTLAFCWSLISLVIGPKRNQASQAIGILLVPLMLIGFIRDWRHPAYPDLRFAQHADKFMDSKRGEWVEIPQTPPGWTLRLVRK
jgi:hypothetical protein